MKHGWSILAVLSTLAFISLLVAGDSRAQFSRFEKPIVWDQYMAGENCAIEKATTRVINNAAEWQSFWLELAGRGASAADAPKDVDWMKDKLIVITLGAKPTPGYSVFVENVERTRASEYVVQYVESQPIPGQLLPQVMTSPFVIIRIEKTVGVPRFEGRKTTQRIFSAPKNVCACRCCAACKCSR